MNIPALTFGVASSDRVDGPSCLAGTTLSALDPYTWCTWVRQTGTITTNKRFMQSGSTTNRKQIIVNGTTGNVQHAFNAVSSNGSCLTSDNPLVIGQWMFFVFSGRTSANPSCVVYHGTLSSPAVESTYSTQTNTSGAMNAEVDGNLVIGNNPANNTTAWLGDIGPCAYVNQFFSLADARYWQYKMLDPTWRPHRRWMTKFHLNLGATGTGTQIDLSGYGEMGTVTGATLGKGPTRRLPIRRATGMPTTTSISKSIFIMNQTIKRASYY